MDKAEQELIFKAYQRGLLRSLKKLKEALQRGDYSHANTMLDELIEDTEKDI